MIPRLYERCRKASKKANGVMGTTVTVVSRNGCMVDVTLIAYPRLLNEESGEESPASWCPWRGSVPSFLSTIHLYED